MPLFIEYLLKSSISIGLVYVFYRLLLRKLTFYNSNRWYLLGYTLLSFFIPFINITPALQRNELAENKVLLFIPSVQTYTKAITGMTECPVPVGFADWNKWDWLMLLLLAGSLLLLVRFIIRFLSFLRIRQNATLVSGGNMKIYQVDAAIIPFSFGGAIFINHHQHTESELKEIILHEFVHVRQKHTIDIVWSELLCMLNWYNPFAWLVRKAIRQNLEFIADEKLMQTGMDRKQYQYLLLKVIGNNHFSIANKFNFSSLKKRIAMMNKMKSARIQLLKFSFLLPLLLVLLLAFRSGKSAGPANSGHSKMKMAGLVIDASSKLPVPFAKIESREKGVTVLTNENGYYQFEMISDGNPLRFVINISKEGYQSYVSTENWGISSGSAIEFFGLVKAGDQAESFGDLAGNVNGVDYNDVMTAFAKWKILDELYKAERAVDTLPKNRPYHSISLHRSDHMDQQHRDFFDRNKNVQLLYWKNNRQLEVYLSSEEIETYLLTDAGSMQKAEKKYGKIPAAAGGSRNLPQTGSESEPGENGMGRQTSFLNKKGNFIEIVDEKRNCTVVVKNNEHVEQHKLLLTEWNRNKKHYEELYGEIPLSVTENESLRNRQDFLQRNPDVKDIGFVYDNIRDNRVTTVHIVKRDGTEEKWDIRDKQQLTELEKKYGKIPFIDPAYEYIVIQPITGDNKDETGDKAVATSLEEQSFRFTADTIVWAAATGKLILKGQATLTNASSRVEVESESIHFDHKLSQRVYIDGKEAEMDRDYTGKKGSKYLLTILEKDEAQKKYGEKGKNGIMEITTQ